MEITLWLGTPSIRPGEAVKTKGIGTPLGTVISVEQDLDRPLALVKMYTSGDLYSYYLDTIALDYLGAP